MKEKLLLLCVLCGFVVTGNAQTNITSKTILVDSNGWANNSVNTVVFRKNSLCTYNNTQYISYYNNDGYVVLGKRKIGHKKWQLQTTSFKGNVADAHNSISIITDGEGYLHMAWNHHGNQLHYSKSIASGSLKMMPETQMTGLLEQKVTYPEFYSLHNGNLLFLYRDGQSGQGNLVVNHYSTKEKKWQLRHHNLIDGEKKRNAYWQACVDAKGIIHISWVWRESADVASNHDMCYAQSTDGGITWTNSKKEKYALPVTAATAEYVCNIPQKSELINQTSIYADEEGNPFIASYWKDKGDSIPQYHIVNKTGTEWVIQNTGFRKTAFSLSGAGTKRIPISRPQLVGFKKNNVSAIMLIFRDEERGNKISLAVNANINFNSWQHFDLPGMNTGSWEPTFDTELWRQKKQLHLFVQQTEQADGEGKGNIGQQPVYVTEIKIR